MSETRSAIERDIVVKSWQVDTSEIDATWLDSLAFYDLQQAWSNLEDYYAAHPDDMQIGIEVIQEYASFTRLLRNVMTHDAYDEDRQQQAATELKAMEQVIEAIGRSIAQHAAGK